MQTLSLDPRDPYLWAGLKLRALTVNTPRVIWRAALLRNAGLIGIIFDNLDVDFNLACEVGR